MTGSKNWWTTPPGIFSIIALVLVASAIAFFCICAAGFAASRAP